MDNCQPEERVETKAEINRIETIGFVFFMMMICVPFTGYGILINDWPELMHEGSLEGPLTPIGTLIMTALFVIPFSVFLFLPRKKDAHKEANEDISEEESRT